MSKKRTAATLSRTAKRPSFTPSADVCHAVEVLIDESTKCHQDVNSEETLLECLMCGEWEGHTNTCCIPALIAWQKGSPQT